VAAGVSAGLLTLTARLRAEGVRPGMQRLLTAHRALAAVEPDRHLARAALRASLCAGRRDVEAFERAFEEIFGDQPIAPIDPGKGGRQSTDVPAGAVGAAGDQAEPEEGEARRVSEWSAVEVLRDKSFRAYTASDRELARAELRRLAAVLPQRPSARRRRAPGRAPRLDLRRTMRAARNENDGLQLDAVPHRDHELLRVHLVGIRHWRQCRHRRHLRVVCCMLSVGQSGQEAEGARRVCR